MAMAQKNLSRCDIEEYVLPEFETLNAFFSKLNLNSTQMAFDFLKDVFEAELEQIYGKKNANKNPPL